MFKQSCIKQKQLLLLYKNNHMKNFTTIGYAKSQETQETLSEVAKIP